MTQNYISSCLHEIIALAGKFNMTTTQALLIILVPAFFSGLAAYPVARWMVKFFTREYESLLLQKSGTIVQSAISGMQADLTNPENTVTGINMQMDKVRPFIEEQVDRFMDEKLPILFPLLVKFMGDKTRQQFRQAFLDETERLFPEVISIYQDSGRQQETISSLSPDISSIKLPQDALHQIRRKVIMTLMVYMFLAGLICGFLLYLCV